MLNDEANHSTSFLIAVSVSLLRKNFNIKAVRT